MAVIARRPVIATGERYRGSRLRPLPSWPLKDTRPMDDIKTNAAAHHSDAALHLENAARMHREAAKQCESGNFEKAQHLAVEAAETDTAAHQHAMQALH